MNLKIAIAGLSFLASCASADTAGTTSKADAAEFRENRSSVGLDMPLGRSEVTIGEMRTAFVCGREILGEKKPVAVDVENGANVQLFSYDKIFLISESEGQDAVRIVKIRRDWDEEGSYLGKNVMVYPEGQLMVDLKYLCTVEELS